MDAVTPQDLVAHFYDQELTPERLGGLVQAWDSARTVGAAGRAAPTAAGFGRDFATAIAEAVETLDHDPAFALLEVEALLGQAPGAALAVSADGRVLALNDAARAAFGVAPGERLAGLPVEAKDLDLLAERVRALAAGPAGREDVVQLRRGGLGRVVHAHLRALPGPKGVMAGVMAGVAGGGLRVLMATSEQAWPERLAPFLMGFFGLTPAEVEVARGVADGGAVTAIAQATRRSVGTVRSQLHAVLQKTGTASQADLARLLGLLRQSVDLEAPADRAEPPPEPVHRFVRLRDGRRLEVLTFGDPEGAPVLRMQTYYGYLRLPRSAEADLGRRGLRMIVPIRAGWGGSDPAPRGRDVLDVAAADARELLAQLGVGRAAVMTMGDDVRIALMLAQAAPDLVRHVVAVGSGFPILNDAQYRRLFPVARFVRACARYQPRALPFLARAFRGTMLRYGIERYMRGLMASTSPADAGAFADREVADAVVAGIHYMFGHDARMEAAFCAEVRRFHEDWPEGLGHVACPVTLVHGAHDGNSPFATALDYCALHPRWRMVEFPDDGVLVAFVRWREVLDLVGEAAGARPGPSPQALPRGA